jgi:hypothetical protein
MIHKGEVVEQAVRNSGMAITKIAQKLGKSRRWMYLMFDNPNIDIETILKIGAIINYDFSDEIRFPTTSNLLSEPPRATYGKSTISKNTMQEPSVAYWREKYYTLLEEYNELLKKSN